MIKPRFGLYVGYLEEDSDQLRQELQNILRQGDGEIIEEFIEDDFKHYPQLKNALQVAQDSQAILLTPTFDRLQFSLNALAQIVASNVKVIVADDPLMLDERQNIVLIKRMNHMAKSKLVEHSRKVSEGLKRAKKAGKKFGPPLGSSNNKLAGMANLAKAEKFRETIRPIIADLKSKGAVTLDDIARGLEARNVPTAKGGSKWYASSVRNVIKGEE